MSFTPNDDGWGFFVGLFQALAWPVVALTLGWLYRDVVRSALPGSKVSFTLFGFHVETALREIVSSLDEALDEGTLNKEQKEALWSLKSQGQIEIDEANITLLRPLRNAGLIRTVPRGTPFVDQHGGRVAANVELTALGRILLKAMSAGESR